MDKQTPQSLYLSLVGQMRVRSIVIAVCVVLAVVLIFPLDYARRHHYDIPETERHLRAAFGVLFGVIALVMMFQKNNRRRLLVKTLINEEFGNSLPEFAPYHGDKSFLKALAKQIYGKKRLLLEVAHTAELCGCRCTTACLRVIYNRNVIRHAGEFVVFKFPHKVFDGCFHYVFDDKHDGFYHLEKQATGIFTNRKYVEEDVKMLVSEDGKTLIDRTLVDKFVGQAKKSVPNSFVIQMHTDTVAISLARGRGWLNSSALASDKDISVMQAEAKAYADFLRGLAQCCEECNK